MWNSRLLINISKYFDKHVQVSIHFVTPLRSRSSVWSIPSPSEFLIQNMLMKTPSFFIKCLKLFQIHWVSVVVLSWDHALPCFVFVYLIKCKCLNYFLFLTSNLLSLISKNFLNYLNIYLECISKEINLYHLFYKNSINVIHFFCFIH